jgi:hypothetical protein
MPSRVQRGVRMVQHRSEGCSVAQLDAELGWLHRLSSRICFSSTVQFLLDFFSVDFEDELSKVSICPDIPSTKKTTSGGDVPEWRLRVSKWTYRKMYLCKLSFLAIFREFPRKLGCLLLEFRI